MHAHLGCILQTVFFLALHVLSVHLIHKQDKNHARLALLVFSRIQSARSNVHSAELANIPTPRGQAVARHVLLVNFLVVRDQQSAMNAALDSTPAHLAHSNAISVLVVNTPLCLPLQFALLVYLVLMQAPLDLLFVWNAKQGNFLEKAPSHVPTVPQARFHRQKVLPAV